MAQPYYVGVDVAKRQLDLATCPVSAAARFAHDEAGLSALVAHVQALAPALVVLEATGGYETDVAAALALAGLPVAVVNPRQVRDFAKAIGRLAKTDALDADVLAQFAAHVRPEPRPLPDAAQQELTALVARRRQLVEMLTAERHRLSRSRGTASSAMSRRTSIFSSSASKRPTPTCALRAGESRLARAGPPAAVRARHRPDTAATLIAELPELGRLVAAPARRAGRRGAAQPRQRPPARPPRHAGAGARSCAPRSTWPRASPRAATPSSAPSISGSAPPASRPRSPSSRPCTSS